MHIVIIILLQNLFDDLNIPLIKLRGPLEADGLMRSLEFMEVLVGRQAVRFRFLEMHIIIMVGWVPTSIILNT